MIGLHYHRDKKIVKVETTDSIEQEITLQGHQFSFPLQLIQTKITFFCPLVSTSVHRYVCLELNANKVSNPIQIADSFFAFIQNWNFALSKHEKLKKQNDQHSLNQ